MDVFLSKGRVAVIDTEDWDIVKKSLWHLHISKRRGKPTNYYARSRIDGKPVYLHRLLMGAHPHQEVDHIDGDGLNCRRANMQLVSPYENKKRRNARRSTEALSAL